MKEIELSCFNEQLLNQSNIWKLMWKEKIAFGIAKFNDQTAQNSPKAGNSYKYIHGLYSSKIYTQESSMCTIFPEADILQQEKSKKKMLAKRPAA